MTELFKNTVDTIFKLFVIIFITLIHKEFKNIGVKNDTFRLSAFCRAFCIGLCSF